MKTFFLFILSLFLIHCATLSKKECRLGQWYDIGRKDGVNGRPLERFEKHIKACSKYDIVPNRSLYEKGRKAGLNSYCTPENGFRVGRRGEIYHDVCPKPLEKEFLKRYRVGLRIYELEQQIQAIDDKITQLENQMEEEKDADQRHYLWIKIRDLRYERFYLQRKLDDIKYSR